MQTADTTKGTKFHYNSDFSGNVIVVVEGNTIEIPGDDILEFVANAFIRQRKISKIEQVAWQNLLK